MRRPRRRENARGLEPDRIRALAEEAGATAEQHRGHVHLKLVDEPGSQRLLNRRGASTPSVTKKNVVPPSISTGSRAWWVRMKTGTWKGGSSPHHPIDLGSSSQGPDPPLNIFLPITWAPTDETRSAITSESSFASPPSTPCCSRHASVARAHSWSSSPFFPSGSSRVGFGPATNPSRDMVMSATTLPMVR
jgi:hypothetical protein